MWTENGQKYVKNDCIFIKIVVDVKSENYEGFIVTEDEKISPMPAQPSRRTAPETGEDESTESDTVA